MSLSSDSLASFEGRWNQFQRKFNGEFWCCDITKDSKFLVTGGQDKTVRVWDLAAGSAAGLMTSHTSNVKGVSVSSNSKFILSGSLDKTVKLWDFLTFELIHTFKNHENSVFCVSISPDETKGTSGSQDNSILLYDLIEKSLIAKLSLLESVKSVKFLNNSAVLSGSFDRSLKIWNLETFTFSSIKTQAKVMSVAFGNSRKLFIAGGDDGSIQIQNEDSQLAGLSGHTGGVRALEVSENDQLLVSGSSDRSVRVWSLSTFTQICLFSGHSGEINGVSLGNKGNFICSVSFDCSIKVWDLSRALEENHDEIKDALKTIKLGSCFEDSISVSGDQVAFGSDENSAVVWDLNQDQEKVRVLGHGKRVTCTAMSLAGTLFTGSADCSIKVWNLDSGTEEFSMTGHSAAVSCLALCGLFSMLVSGSADRTVRVWDLKTRSVEKTFTGHAASISSVDVNLDGSLAFSSAMDCFVKVWKVRTGELLFDLGFHKEKVWKVLLTDDQVYLVSASHFEFVSVFDLNQATQVAKIESLEQAEEWFLRYPEIRKKFLRYL